MHREQGGENPAARVVLAKWWAGTCSHHCVRAIHKKGVQDGARPQKNSPILIFRLTPVTSFSTSVHQHLPPPQFCANLFQIWCLIFVCTKIPSWFEKIATQFGFDGGESHCFVPYGGTMKSGVGSMSLGLVSSRNDFPGKKVQKWNDSSNYYIPSFCHPHSVSMLRDVSSTPESPWPQGQLDRLQCHFQRW